MTASTRHERIWEDANEARRVETEEESYDVDEGYMDGRIAWMALELAKLGITTQT